MAGSLNRVTLIGNVGRDPEVRSTSNGSRAASFSVATSEEWKDRTSGEKKSQTEWHAIVVWSPGLVGVVEKYVKKGSKIMVEGKLKTRKWTDNSGQDRYTTEVVLQAYGGTLILLGSGGGAGRPPAAESEDDYDAGSRGGDTDAVGYRSGGGRAPARDDLDDDIPF